VTPHAVPGFGINIVVFSINVHDKRTVQTSERYTFLAQHDLPTSFTNPTTNSQWIRFQKNQGLLLQLRLLKTIQSLLFDAQLQFTTYLQ